jgi:two-component system, OmpR family, phosphate regulon sensor histidine kinase PhoR
MFAVSIRSSTLRLGIFISSLIIATILIFQLIWLKKVYHREQKEFDYSIVKVVRALYQDLDVSAYYSSHLNELIENPEPNLYIARITLPVNTDSLTSYLQYELEDFNVFTDCHLGIYSAVTGKHIYSGLLTTTRVMEEKDTLVPKSSRSYDHLTLYFPNRKQYILAQMDFWILSSAILLLVLILFGGSLYYFYKQKFLNETQKDLIHNFTHEFKTPVAVISLAADVLNNPTIVEKPEKLATYAGIVKYQASYLHNQIEKLLKFAHTDSQHLHLDKEKVNIHALIQEAMDNISPLIMEKKASLKLELGATEPFINADKDYMVIVITNLIDNAIKYSRDPRISIITKNDNGLLRISVTDNGIGIEKKLLKKIFHKFFRARSGETYAAKGFGIGLSFVKKIVNAHNGRIKVESKPGSGSSFSIELPVQ